MSVRVFRTDWRRGKMKRLVLFLTLVLVFGGFSTVSASLIGVGPLIANQYPDILFDNTGTIVYNSTSNQFVLTADDIKIAYSPTSYEYITTVAMSISLTVNESGYGSGMMTEIVKEGQEVTINGVTYGAGTTILAGNVYAFGRADAAAPGTGYWDFDFLVGNAYGALIDGGVWPSNKDIGITATAEDLNGWAGSWDSDFVLNKVKGDKAPIPEPATMALLAFGGLLLRRKK